MICRKGIVRLLECGDLVPGVVVAVGECVPVGGCVELMLGWPEMLINRIVDGTEPGAPNECLSWPHPLKLDTIDNSEPDIFEQGNVSS